MPDPEHKQEHGNPGYEITDVNVKGVTLFIVALGVFMAVFLVFCFGIGRVINTALSEHDGPLNKWNAVPGETQKPQNLQSDAEAQQRELQRMTQKFPQPRVQVDNGDQDVADLHAKEDLLLDHYSWVDQKSGKVRIPVSRAMELIVKRGLPVAPPVQTQPLMMGDKAPVVIAPLTNGFARTGFEQKELRTIEQKRMRGEASPGERASLSQTR